MFRIDLVITPTETRFLSYEVVCGNNYLLFTFIDPITLVSLVCRLIFPPEGNIMLIYAEVILVIRVLATGCINRLHVNSCEASRTIWSCLFVNFKTLSLFICVGSF